MTGPQHYRQAEEFAQRAVDLLQQSASMTDEFFGRVAAADRTTTPEFCQKQAHIHAMLAVAAATQEAGPHHPTWWDEVLDG